MSLLKKLLFVLFIGVISGTISSCDKKDSIAAADVTPNGVKSEVQETAGLGKSDPNATKGLKDTLPFVLTREALSANGYRFIEGALITSKPNSPELRAGTPVADVNLPVIFSNLTSASLASRKSADIFKAMDDVNKGPTSVWGKCVGVWLNNTTIGTPVYGANATPDDAAFNPARIVFNEPVVTVTSRTVSQPVVVGVGDLDLRGTKTSQKIKISYKEKKGFKFAYNWKIALGLKLGVKFSVKVGAGVPPFVKGDVGAEVYSEYSIGGEYGQNREWTTEVEKGVEFEMAGTPGKRTVVKALESTITEKYEYRIPVRGYTGKFYGHHQGPFFQKWYRGVAASSLASFLGIPNAETAVGSRSYKMYSVIAVDYN